MSGQGAQKAPADDAVQHGSTRPGGEERLHRPRRLSIRARLTLTYAGLVTAAGAVLIALVYFYTRYVTLSIAFDPPQQIPLIDTTTPQAAKVDTNLFELLSAILRSAVGMLMILAVVSGTVGWVLAGRMLRPLSSMNAAAKRAASGDLSQRLALSGPRDEIHDLADTFDNMLASLERSFSVHRRFAANASHELRTPLATTQTMIDVALSDPQASAEDLRRVLTRVLETNRANRETIDALLDLADAQSGKLAREDVDMEATVRDALSVIAPEVAERDLHVSTHLLPARVPGDPTHPRPRESSCAGPPPDTASSSEQLVPAMPRSPSRPTIAISTSYLTSALASIWGLSRATLPNSSLGQPSASRPSWPTTRCFTVVPTVTSA